MQHHKHGVGTSYGAHDEWRLAHVDVIGKTGGVAIAGLDDGDIAREIDRHEAHLLIQGNAVQPAFEHGVLQVVVVGYDIGVVAAVRSYFSDLEGFQVARKGGLRDIDTIFSQQNCQFVLATYVVVFDEINDELQSVSFIFHDENELDGFRFLNEYT